MKPIAVVLLLLWFQVMEQSSARMSGEGITRRFKNPCNGLLPRLRKAIGPDGPTRSIDTSSAPVPATVPTTSINEPIEEIHPDVNEDVSRLREEDQLNNPSSGSPPPHPSPDQGAHSSAHEEYYEDDHALAYAMEVSMAQKSGHPGASSVDGPNPVSIPNASLNEEPGASHDVNPSPLHSQNERDPPSSGMPTPHLSPPQPPASRSAPVAATVPTTSTNEDVSRLRADNQLNNPSSGSPPPHQSPDQGAHSSAFAPEEYIDDYLALEAAVAASLAEMPDHPGASSVDGPAYNGELDEEVALSNALASSVPGIPDHPGASSVDRPDPVSIPKASLKEEPAASHDVNSSQLHSQNVLNPPLPGMPTPNLSPPQPPASQSGPHPIPSDMPEKSYPQPGFYENPTSHKHLYGPTQSHPQNQDFFQRPRQSYQDYDLGSYPTEPNKGTQVGENSRISIAWFQCAIVGYCIFVLYLKGFFCHSD